MQWVSVLRGLFDFGRTYTTDSLSQKVAYDVRNQMYDKLQHLSFAFHDKEHTGNLMSKVTSDVEAIRRYVNMGMVRGIEVPVRVLAIVVLLVALNWQLTILSLVFVPFVVVRPSITAVMARWICRSVSTSTLEVESSRIRTGGSISMVRAIDRRCLCPPDRVTPLSPTQVS